MGIAWVVECAEQRSRVDETKFLVDLEGVNVAGTNKVCIRNNARLMRMSLYMMLIFSSSAGGLCCPSYYILIVLVLTRLRYLRRLET